MFCDPDEMNFYISTISPCAPGNSGGCGLIGALEVGCMPTATARASWGKVKNLY